jgi:chemotaxis protein CheD
VGIADFAVGTDDAVLTTSGLGSCIGVVLYDADARVAGLAHAMLPSADSNANPAKFADTGIEALLTEMESHGADQANVSAKLAGGSTMFDFAGTDGGKSIGDRNVEAARQTLSKFGIDILAEDVGGSHGRSLELDGESGTLTIRSAKNGTYEL